jgi:galactokinase
MNPGPSPVVEPAQLPAGGRAAQVRELFRNQYGGDCRLFRAPGRINLIGEHTDYNEGFVMPAAVDLDCWVAVAPVPDRAVVVYSSNFKDARTFHLDQPKALRDWSDYVQGVALMLDQSGYRIPGAKMLIASDVPMGSGLSSSAAVEVAAGLALLDLQKRFCDRLQLAQLCRRAENEFVGARCGIMDQFICCHGKAGHLTRLDCRSLQHNYFRLPDDVRLVICNTMVKHANASGEYNVRRSQCEAGVQILSGPLQGISALRDASLEDLERLRAVLPPIVYKRCLHVISENHRVQLAAAALEEGNLQRFGQLMAASHRSLRDDYEVSSPELDLMVDLANRAEGVYGARMTGGGFGGCTVNLVAAGAVPEFTTKIAAAYQARIGVVPDVRVCIASEGAGPYP